MSLVLNPAMTTSEVTDIQRTHETIEKQIQNQIDYYFSLKNLVVDAFLLSRMNARMMIPVVFIMKFKRIRQLSTDLNDILEAVKKVPDTFVVEEIDSHWYIGPYPYAAHDSRCTIELVDVDDAVDVEDIEDLTPTCPLIHSYNFANGMWYATYESEDVALTALNIMISNKLLLKGRPVRASIRTMALDGFVSPDLLCPSNYTERPSCHIRPYDSRNNGSPTAYPVSSSVNTGASIPCAIGCSEPQVLPVSTNADPIVTPITFVPNLPITIGAVPVPNLSPTPLTHTPIIKSPCSPSRNTTVNNNKHQRVQLRQNFVFPPAVMPVGPPSFGMFPMKVFGTDACRQQMGFYHQLCPQTFNNQKIHPIDVTPATAVDAESTNEYHCSRNSTKEVGVQPTTTNDDDVKTVSDDLESKEESKSVTKSHKTVLRSQIAGYRIVAHSNVTKSGDVISTTTSEIAGNKIQSSGGRFPVPAPVAVECSPPMKELSNTSNREEDDDRERYSVLPHESMKHDSGLAQSPIVKLPTPLSSTAPPFFGGRNFKNASVNNSARSRTVPNTTMISCTENLTSPSPLMRRGHTYDSLSFSSAQQHSQMTYQRPFDIWHPKNRIHRNQIHKCRGLQVVESPSSEISEIIPTDSVETSLESSKSHFGNINITEEKPADRMCNVLVPIGDEFNTEEECLRLGGGQNRQSDVRERNAVCSYIIVDAQRNTRINNPYCISNQKHLSSTSLIPLGVGIKFCDYRPVPPKHQPTDAGDEPCEETSDTQKSFAKKIRDTDYRYEAREEREEVSNNHAGIVHHNNISNTFTNGHVIDTSNFPPLSYFDKKSTDTDSTGDDGMPKCELNTATKKLSGWAATAAASPKQKFSSKSESKTNVLVASQKLNNTTLQDQMKCDSKNDHTTAGGDPQQESNINESIICKVDKNDDKSLNMTHDFNGKKESEDDDFTSWATPDPRLTPDAHVGIHSNNTRKHFTYVEILKLKD